jgi:hypothetical protein
LEVLTETSITTHVEPLIAGLASQFMAAIPENPNADNLVIPFAKQTFWAHRIGNDALIQSQLRAIEGDLLGNCSTPHEIS